MNRLMLRARLLLTLVAFAMTPPGAAAQGREKLPRGAVLKDLVLHYLAADEAEKTAIREDCDRRFEELKEGPELVSLRAELLKISASFGPRISFKGRNFLYEKDGQETGKYLARGGGRSLFFGLHGGGIGSGSAESMAGAMGGGGHTWIFPEVLEKTARGWTTSGTEEFVVDLVRAAKRSGKIDPDRIYLSGHSMGGYGTWTIGGHHADLFAGLAAYAGAPTPVFADGSNQEVIGLERGVLPNLYNLRHFFFQSLDDRQVPPGPNVFANGQLQKLAKEHAGGFDFRYQQVEDRGHRPPAEGYLPGQSWVAEAARKARPKILLWEPSLDWKHQFYWLYWKRPDTRAEIRAEWRGDGVVTIDDLSGDRLPRGLCVLVGRPLADPDAKIMVRLDGKVVFAGRPKRQLSTLLLTLVEHDDSLLFDARVESAL